MLTLKVTSIDFDPTPDEANIRLSGKNAEQNKFVKLGAFHTAVIEANRQFTIFKDSWDYITLERLKEASDPTKKAKLAAIVMQAGLAHVCLITNNLTLLRAKVQKAFPKKKGTFSKISHSEAKTKFYRAVYDALLKHIDLSVVKCVIIASPGFTKDEFYAFLLEQGQKSQQTASVNHSKQNTGSKKKNAARHSEVNGINLGMQLKVLSKSSARSMFILVHCSTGYKQSLDEVLQDENVLKRIEQVSAVREVTILKTFFEYLSSRPDQAIYSYQHVKYALQQSAVKTLLISDSLFRSTDLKTRRVYVDLVEDCREKSNVEVTIFSAMHVSGQQLDKMTGIAAILRYDLPDIEELIASENNDIQSDKVSNEFNSTLEEHAEKEELEEIDRHPEIYF